jgi:prefoldin subunit 5
MLATEELYRDHQLFRSTMQEHEDLQAELTRLMGQWEKLQQELEDLSQQ